MTSQPKHADIDWRRPEYEDAVDDWTLCRDVAAGEKAVRGKRRRYLPKPLAMGLESYEYYLARSFFYPATGRVVEGMTGALTAKPASISTPAEFASDPESYLTGFLPGRDEPFEQFLKRLIREALIVGRVCLFVDKPLEGPAYLAVRHAEQLINWRTGVDSEGRRQLELAVLKEEVEIPVADREGLGVERATYDRWRVLRLVPDLESEGAPMRYESSLWIRNPERGRDEAAFVLESEPVFPRWRAGGDFPRLPLFVVNAAGVGPDVRPPPLLGLATLNLAHWRDTADHQKTLFYAANHFPFISGVDRLPEGVGTGSDRVLITDKADARATMLGINGSQAAPVENALAKKEELMQVVGDRLLETPKTFAESAENRRTLNAGQNNVLSSIAASLSDGLSDAIRLAADWDGLDPSGETYVKIEPSSDATIADPALIQQLHSLLAAGEIDRRTFFDRGAEMGIFKDVTFEEYEARRDAMAPGDRALVGAPEPEPTE